MGLCTAQDRGQKKNAWQSVTFSPKYVKNIFDRETFLIDDPYRTLRRRVTYLPYSIHLGKKFNVKSQSKVRSPQSEVHKCVSILLIFPKILIQGH